MLFRNHLSKHKRLFSCHGFQKWKLIDRRINFEVNQSFRIITVAYIERMKFSSSRSFRFSSGSNAFRFVLQLSPILFWGCHSYNISTSFLNSLLFAFIILTNLLKCVVSFVFLSVQILKHPNNINSDLGYQFKISWIMLFDIMGNMDKYRQILHKS